MQEYIVGKLGLILPKHTGKLLRKREMTPEAIEHWRSHLDLNDLEKSCKSLYSMLLDTHQAALSPTQRFEILNTLRPTVSYLSQSLMKLCPDNKGIINDRYRMIMELSQQLNLQLYHGYKMILEKTARNIFTHRDLTFESLFTCLHITSKLIFESYYQYRKPAKFLWKECHLIYQLSVKKRYHRRTLSKMTHWSSRFNNLEDIYKHILLFATAQPNHHTPERLEQLKYASEAWAPLVSFQGKNKYQPYFVSPSLDHGPIFVKKDTPPEHPGQYLDLNKLVAHLDKLYAYLEEPAKRKNESAFSPVETNIATEFIELLLNTWTNRGERAQQRLKAEGKLDTCLGINAIHWFIAQQTPDHSLNEYEEENLDVDVIDLSALPLPDQSSQSKEVHYDSYSCEIVDESAGGACLKWLHAVPSNLCCGELIAILRDDDGEPTWWIGNIRWLKENENKEILFGIQYLSRQAFATNAWLMDANQQQAVCTLMLPEQPEFGRKVTLLTPSIPFKTGYEVNLFFNQQIYDASLQTLYSNSNNFQHYDLEFLSEAPNLEQYTSQTLNIDQSRAG